MKIAIVKERRPHETRVAATPETVKKLKALGAEVTIEAGAGTAAAYTDQAYSEAGAPIVPDAAAAMAAGDIVFKIARPMSGAEGVDELAMLRQGQTLMAPLGALTNKELVQALASKGVTSFALELIPRITRAQSMDILSSQANLAGYKAVLTAANTFGRIVNVSSAVAMQPNFMGTDYSAAKAALLNYTVSLAGSLRGVNVTANVLTPGVIMVDGLLRFGRQRFGDPEMSFDDVARNFANKVQCGMVGINVPIPVPLSFHSFGGWKNSMFGDMNQHGPEGVRFYSRVKTITARWREGVNPGASFGMPLMK